MVEAVRSTATGPVDIYLATDDDDPFYPYVPVTSHMRGPRKRLAQWTNELAGEALRHGADILAFLGDDHRPRTPGWDERVEEAFRKMGSGLVYCDDGLQGERLPTAPFWSAGIVRELGWFYPPTLQHMYADDYWLRLASDLGRRTYLPDVLIEHCHWSNGKSAKDTVYDESERCLRADHEAFQALIRDEHPAILERVRRVL
jgi:hypothetical protein